MQLFIAPSDEAAAEKISTKALESTEAPWPGVMGRWASDSAREDPAKLSS